MRCRFHRKVAYPSPALSPFPAGIFVLRTTHYRLIPTQKTGRRHKLRRLLQRRHKSALIEAHHLRSRNRSGGRISALYSLETSSDGQGPGSL